jgi:hypothetical protein
MIVDNGAPAPAGCRTSSLGTSVPSRQTSWLATRSSSSRGRSGGRRRGSRPPPRRAQAAARRPRRDLSLGAGRLAAEHGAEPDAWGRRATRGRASVFHRETIAPRPRGAGGGITASFARAGARPPSPQSLRRFGGNGEAFADLFLDRMDPARFGAWVENTCLAYAWNAGQRITYWLRNRSRSMR